MGKAPREDLILAGHTEEYAEGAALGERVIKTAKKLIDDHPDPEVKAFAADVLQVIIAFAMEEDR